MAKFAHSISIIYCSDCQCIHVGLFDEDEDMIGIGNIADVERLIDMLQQAKDRKDDWALTGDAGHMQ